MAENEGDSGTEDRIVRGAALGGQAKGRKFEKHEQFISRSSQYKQSGKCWTPIQIYQRSL